MKINKLYYRFGLLPMRFLCLTLTLFYFTIGILMSARAGQLRSKWLINEPELGSAWRTLADIVMVYGIIKTLIGFFTMFALMLRYILLTMTANVLVGITIIVELLFGFGYWADMRFYFNLSHVTLRSRMNGLDPIQLDKVQKNFHCCGIENHIDYLMLWRLYDVPYDPTPSAEFEGEPIRHPSRSRPKYKRDSQYVLPRVHAGILSEPKVGKDHKTWRQVPYRHGDNIAFSIVEVVTDKNKPSLLYRQRLRESPSAEDKEIEALQGMEPSFREHFETPPPVAQAGGNSIWDWFKGKINKWWDFFFPSLANTIKTVSLRMGFSYSKIYQAFVPGFVRDFLHMIFHFVFQMFEGTGAGSSSFWKWWFGSGWDDWLWHALTPANIKLLPFSCCRKPTQACFGSPETTYVDGCKYVVYYFWRHTGLEMSITLICSAILSYIVAHSIYIYTCGMMERKFF